MRQLFGCTDKTLVFLVANSNLLKSQLLKVSDKSSDGMVPVNSFSADHVVVVYDQKRLYTMDQI